MLVIPTNYKGPRGHKTRPAPASTAPTGPLEVISAEVTAGTGLIVITLLFNTTPAYPLVGVASATPGKWTAYYGNEIYVGGLMEQTAYNAITLTMVFSEPVDANNQLIYAAGPSDISDAAGRQLAAFEMEL